MKKPLLLVVDVQQDFCPGGALAVSDGSKIVPKINEYIDLVLKNGGEVAYTQDWHPLDHISFAANHEGHEPFETIKTPQGDQLLWPKHCLQRTIGADFEANLNVFGPIFQKGMDKNKEEYSALAGKNSQLFTYLKSRNITSIIVCGLATDFCVKAHVLDLIELNTPEGGYDVFVAKDAIAGVAEASTKEALDEMTEAGAEFIEYDDSLLKEVVPV